MNDSSQQLEFILKGRPVDGRKIGKRAPLPISTHSNIARTLESGLRTGTRLLHTPVEATLKIVSVDGSPVPTSKIRKAATSRVSIEHGVTYKVTKGNHRFLAGSDRDAIFTVLSKAKKGMTLGQLQIALPKIAGKIPAALQKLKACGKVKG